VLNADDPLVASLGYNLETDNKPIYFGVNDYVGPKLVNDHTADSIFNPFTQEKLYYTQQYFGHIGKYRGKSGGFTRPKPDFSANNVKQIGTTSIKFNINSSKETVKLDLVGLFNVYNALAAFSLVKSATSTADEVIYSALKDSSAAFGRSEEVDFEGRSLLLLLIKNPTGLNQIIQTYLSREKDRLLVFVINDNYADGRDVSWLWDAALEDLKSYKGKIIVGGTRADDMALRLKYAGLEDVLVESDNNKLIEAILVNSTKRSKIFLLPTYTAMLDLRAKLTAQDTKTKEYWK
jgi:UDP-N-acetylmuramyl tripeptide synthase